jgi:hypothetical protein
MVNPRYVYIHKRKATSSDLYKKLVVVMISSNVEVKLMTAITAVARRMACVGVSCRDLRPQTAGSIPSSAMPITCCVVLFYFFKKGEGRGGKEGD